MKGLILKEEYNEKTTDVYFIRNDINRFCGHDAGLCQYGRDAGAHRERGQLKAAIALAMEDGRLSEAEEADIAAAATEEAVADLMEENWNCERVLQN